MEMILTWKASGADVLVLENWAWCFVDAITGNIFTGALTGTPTQPFPNVAFRYIQVQGRRLHRLDGGNVFSKWDTKWEGSKSYTKYWDECEICHKRLNETEYV